MSPHQEQTLADFAVIALCGRSAILARQRIVRRYLPMIRTQARHVARFYRVDVVDLIQDGVLALYHAIDRYDPSHASEATFMGYATYFVRTACHKSARRTRNAASQGVANHWTVQEVLPLQNTDGEHLDGVPAKIEETCDAHRVYDAIRAVPGTSGRVVCRFHLDGVDMLDVAREMGVSRQRVHQLLTEGEAMVRDALAPRRVA